MLDVRTVDLYEHNGYDRKGAAGGQMSIWSWHTTQEISPHGRRRPGVLILPGGGYQFTSSREAEPVAMHFAAQGYSAFVLDYSTAPSIFPTALREAAMAMQYIRVYADALEIDPHMVAAIGFSAGAHLCGTLGTMFDCPEVGDIAAAEIIKPDALGLCYPVAISWGKTHEGSFRHLTGSDDREKWQRFSLDTLVRTDMPPVFLWHTRDDPAVPVRNSLILSQALDEAGISFAMHIYRSGPHGLSLADAQVYPASKVPITSWDVPQWYPSMMQFFRELGFTITDQEA